MLIGFEMEEIEELVKVRDRGTITIPQNIRMSVGVDDGMYLMVTCNNGKIELEPVDIKRKLKK